MSSPALERFLARIYVDAAARERFLAAPFEAAREAGLTEEQSRSLEAIDRTGLMMAARSYSRKRSAKAARRSGWTEGLSPWRRIARADGVAWVRAILRMFG
ncbi:MAG TPA: hypothetical protein VL285_19450 [Bryobacteraceae bacterium]|jgi:hypothetical protein|nr:hypothetical protein [Bryobacteraceae bacterium]